jgi:hypothetical protein
MPASIIGRAADVWEPLVAIADAAGGEWPERARAAAVTLNNARAERDPSLGVQLLSDCRRIFTSQDVDRLTTENLIDALIALDDAPWGDLKGKPIDPRGLSWRLRKYEIRPETHRFREGARRGYRIEDMHDAWQRYLPTVADVADVADVQPKRDSGDAVADYEAEVGGDLLSNPLNGSLSTSVEAQQAQQAQLCSHCGQPEMFRVGRWWCPEDWYAERLKTSSDTATDECAPEVIAADPGDPFDDHDHAARLAYVDSLELAEDAA